MNLLEHRRDAAKVKIYVRDAISNHNRIIIATTSYIFVRIACVSARSRALIAKWNKSSIVSSFSNGIKQNLKRFFYIDIEALMENTSGVPF